MFPAFSVLAGVPKAAAIEAMRIAAANLRLLHDAGVPIVFGADASFGVALLSRPCGDLGRIRVGAAADLLVAEPALAHDLAAPDADRPGNTLAVFARGQRVPATTSPGRIAQIVAAYLEGTATTLAHTFQSWARASLPGVRAS